MKGRLPLQAGPPVWALVVIFVFNCLSYAQNQPVLSVKVHTATGIPIAGATVRVERGRSFTIQAITDSDGKTEIFGLTSSNYRVTVLAEGFHRSALDVTIYDIRQETETDVTLVPTLRRSEAVDVIAETSDPQMPSPQPEELKPADVDSLPTRPMTVTEALPAVPGVSRISETDLEIAGHGEQHSAFLVNSSDTTEPVTGRFGTTVPLDSIKSIVVTQPPFLPQYGGFTSAVVAVETQRGGEKWHYSFKEPFPVPRVRSHHIRGLRDLTPRFSFSGPLIQDKLFFSEAAQYKLDKTPVRTLPFPYNESKEELVNSFSQFDYISSSRHFVTATVHVAPHHTNFVGLTYFTPQPTTPSFRGRDRSVDITDHFVVSKALFETSLSRQDFVSRIGSQGDADMILTPTGNSGNYFGRRRRNSSRTEVAETLSINTGAAHALKFGVSLARATNDVSFQFQPVEIQDANGLTLERIDFTEGNPLHQSDIYQAFYGQDHWTITPRLALDGGIRGEYQAQASTLRFGPRVAAVWTPLPTDPAVIRAGYGVFYDHVPLGVYAFGSNPEQILTVYDPTGNSAPVVHPFTNIVDPDSSSRFPLVLRGNGPGDFAPHSQTWTVGVERPVTQLLHVQINYEHSNSAGDILLTPQLRNGNDFDVMGGGGRSTYRQMEITTRTSWRGGQQLLFTYIRSKARGDLNTYGTYINDFPSVPLQANVYSNLRGDIPNRILLRGIVNTPGKTKIIPIFEFHSGQPYASLQANRDYAGVPYSDATRFPAYVSLDPQVSKDVRVKSSRTVRLSLSVLNMLNHFNPLEVHANTADPLSGTFFGYYRRRYRADFSLLF